MTTFYIFLTVLYILACIFLIIFILLQQSSNSMGILGGTSNTLLGSSSGDILTKITAYLATIFFVGAVILSIMSGISKDSGSALLGKKKTESVIESIKDKNKSSVTNLNILKDLSGNTKNSTSNKK